MIQTDSQKEAIRFIQQFKEIDFQLPLENMKRQTFQIEGDKIYKDLYLVQKLFPALIEGLEELSRTVENCMFDKDIDNQVRTRFNPCIFLAQYLMRNNPNKQCNKSQTHLTKHLKAYCRKQKFSRFFLQRHKGIQKIFSKSLNNKEKSTCDIAEMKLFARDFDQKLGLKGGLRDYLSSNKILTKIRGQIKLDEIIQEIAKYCVSNTTINQKDFIAIFDKFEL